jgi:hypothetical protein
MQGEEDGAADLDRLPGDAGVATFRLVPISLFRQGWSGWYNRILEVKIMQTAYIKFLTDEDRVQGFYELATRSRVGSLPGQVYQVPIESLAMLDDRQISYRQATEEEVKAAHDQVRNPSPSVL